MAKQIASKIKPICDAIKTQIVGDGSLISEDKIFFVSKGGKIPNLVGQLDILIRPWGFGIDHGDGGGNISQQAKRKIDIEIRFANTADQIGQDYTWLFDTNGFFDWEEYVAGRLSNFLPTDSNHNGLTVDPLKIIGGSQPLKLPNNTAGWGSSVIQIEAIYVPDFPLES